MKATLEFNLPDEDYDYRVANMAGEMQYIVWEIDSRLRSLLKHGNPSPETADLADEIRKMIASVLVDS